MKCLILNGSPKVDSKKCHTQVFIDSFLAGMTEEVAVKHIYKEAPQKLAKEIQAYDTIIMVMPLYIHAMPSGVMALIEAMKESEDPQSALGFMVQAGFPESYHEKWLCDYFEGLSERLHYRYLGTVVKGGCAFMEQYPDKAAQLKKKIEILGREFEKTGQFDQQIKEEFAMPYQMPKGMRPILKIACKFGMVDRDWKRLLKENHALEHAKDQPFLKPLSK